MTRVVSTETWVEAQERALALLRGETVQPVELAEVFDPSTCELWVDPPVSSVGACEAWITDGDEVIEHKGFAVAPQAVVVESLANYVLACQVVLVHIDTTGGGEAFADAFSYRFGWRFQIENFRLGELSPLSQRARVFMLGRRQHRWARRGGGSLPASTGFVP